MTRWQILNGDARTLPAEDFAPLQKRFRFTIDAAAHEDNHRLPRWFSPAHCGLQNSWAGERVYCNPPYSDIEPWVLKAHKSAAVAPLIVLLLPANRTEQGWWQRLVEPYRDQPTALNGNATRLRVEFLYGRIRFVAPDQKAIGPNECPRFGSCLLIWSESAVPAIPPGTLL